jgi:hypothetical protein
MLKEITTQAAREVAVVATRQVLPVVYEGGKIVGGCVLYFAALGVSFAVAPRIINASARATNATIDGIGDGFNAVAGGIADGASYVASGIADGVTGAWDGITSWFSPAPKKADTIDNVVIMPSGDVFHMAAAE